MYATIGNENKKQYKINLSKLNRHGVISGATGKGKTTTVKKMIEVLKDNGINSLVADIKGDLASLGQAGKGESYPIDIIDLYGEKGRKTSISIQDFGVDAMANLIGLSDVQKSVLTTCMLLCQDGNYHLSTLEELKTALDFMYNNYEEVGVKYGYLAQSSIATIIRKLNTLIINGNKDIFNKTDIDPFDIINKEEITILDCQRLSKQGNVYASAMNYILRVFYNDLEEVGDLDKPRGVIFIDEAHLLFKKASKDVIQSNIELIKLIRSKGIGIIFISQLPTDIPKEILSQLGLVIQHGLNIRNANDYNIAKGVARAFTDKKGLEDYIDRIKALGTGKTLIAQQDDKGIPVTSEVVCIDLPQSKNGVLSEAIRSQFVTVDVQSSSTQPLTGSNNFNNEQDTGSSTIKWCIIVTLVIATICALIENGI